MKKTMIIPAVIGVLAGLFVLPRALSAARPELGLKFGANIAFLRGADVGVLPGYNSDWVLRFGLCGGGFVVFPLSEDFAIQAEALITTKGSKQVGALFEESSIYSLMITYLEIPVLLRIPGPQVRGRFHFVLMAGPALAVKLSHRFTRSGEIVDLQGVRSTDLGLVVSIGSQSMSRLYSELRYTAGLNKVIEDGGVPLKIKNGVVSMIVGFRF